MSATDIFIGLDDRTLWVRLDHITALVPSETGCEVVTISDRRLYVDESVEDVFELIRLAREIASR